MRHIPTYLLDVAFLLPLIFGVGKIVVGILCIAWLESVIEKRKCYQCEVTDLSLCTDEYLLPCPENQAYDSCMTRISKNKNDGVLWIHKSCALGPCSLRDESQSTGLGLDHCDRSQAEFDCISCCRKDGCNTGGAAIYRPGQILIFFLGLMLPFVKTKIFL